MKSFHLKIVLSIALSVILLPIPLHSATISYVGSDSSYAGVSVIPWRDSSSLKPLDGDGDNIYGTIGYIVYAADSKTSTPNGQGGGTSAIDPLHFSSDYGAGTLSTTKSIPTEIELANGSQDRVFYWTYAPADNPQSGNDVIFGMAGNNVAKGTSSNVLSIVFSEDYADLRIGIMARPEGDGDGLGTIELSTSGSSAGASGVPGNTTNSGRVVFYFFDVTDIAAGDTLNLNLGKLVTTGGSANVLYYGITFDAIPEPGSAVLALTAGGFLLICFRNRLQSRSKTI